MSCISKADFAKPVKLKTEKHAMPEFGKSAYVNIKALSSKDLVDLQKSFGSGVDESHSFAFALKLLTYCLVDDEGNRLFAEEEEVSTLMQHEPKLIERLGQAAIEVSGLGPAKN